MFNALSNQGFLSPDGLCKAFDASADGYGRGEGFAALVLKPVEKAIRDGDTIRAIIRGSATNQDGKTRSMTMPNGEAQEELIREAYRSAGLDFKDTSYFEAHGTGTSAGDFAELNAIANTITHERDKSLWVGSVKTNIGHLESVAGLAGIIKSIQILEHGLIPPSLHFHNPNPHIPFKEWRIAVPTEELPWPEEGIRRISVNSFGFGGSNAHIILDDAYHYLAARGIKAPHNTIQTSLKGRKVLRSQKEDSSPFLPYMMILSSSDQDGLKRQRQALLKYLKDNASIRHESTQAFLRDLAFTLSEKRSRLPWKTLFTASTVSELTQALEASTPLEVRSNSEPRLAFIFTGQGAQWARMGIELLQYRIFRESVESAERYLRRIGCPWSVMEELQREDAISNINQPLYSQTICTVLQVAIVQLLTSWNITARSVVGHSSGEIAAAYAIGAISREDAWKVAYWRGKLSSELLKSSPNLTGSMMAIGASAEQAQKWLDELTEGKCVVACVNSPSSVTISGDEAGIDELAAKLKQREIFARKLKVDTAYHSHHMLAVKDPYTKALANMKTRQGPPNGPQMFTSVTGHVISANELGPSHWVTNLTSPVLFSDAVRELLRPKSREDQNHGCSADIMVEIGPHSALQGPIRQILSGFGATNTEYRSVMSRGKNAVDTILTAVCDLVSRNSSADILAINTCNDDSITSFNSPPALIADLPSYAWNKTKSYWNESRVTRQIKQRSSPRLSLLGAPLPSFAQLEQQWRGFVRIAEEPWLRDHKIQGSIQYPTASYIAMALEAASQVADKGRAVNRYKLRDIQIRNNITMDEGSQTEFITRLRASTSDAENLSEGWLEFSITSSGSDDSLQLHCSGLLVIEYGNSKDAAANTESTHEEQAMKDLYLLAEEECQGSQDAETFYKNLHSIGLEYGPSFQSLKDIRYDTRGQSYCTVEIVNHGLTPAVLSTARPHVIHTTTLYGAIQAAVAAFKGDDGNVKGYLTESFVEEIVVKANIPFEAGARFKGCAKISQQGSSDAISNMFLLDEKTDQGVISIKGLHFVVDAISRTSQRDGDSMSLQASPFTCKMDWIPAFDLLSSGKKQEMLGQIDKPNGAEVQHLMKEQQTAHVAIREAIEKANGMRIPNLQLRNFAKWMKQQLNASSFPLETDISSDIKLSKSLTEVLCASVDPESLLGTEKSVDKLVDSLRGMRISQNKLIKIVAVMAQIKPNIAILELGADNTSPFLASARDIPDTVNYTYACPSAIGLQEIKDLSQAFLLPTQLKVLNIGLDVRKQGFEPSSYDIIIGCNVFSNSKSLQRTMANLKGLLKDGGKICIAELTNPGPTVLPVLGGIYEWWKKRDDGSSRPLKLDSIQSVFNDHHFGIDFVSSDFDASPLHQTSVVFASAARPKDEVTILQAPNCSKAAQELASKVSQRLQNDGISSRVCAWGSDDIDYKGKRFIALLEFELPFLETLTQRDFEVLKRLATEAASLQWVTALPDPQRSSALGFARVVRNEIPAIRFQTLQLDTDSVTLLDRAAALVYQVETSTTTENEFREVDGVLHVPRVVENQELNERLSQKSPDLGTVELMPLGSTTGSQKLVFRNDGVSESLYFEADELRNNDLDKDEIEINVKASALSRRDVIARIGPESNAALDLEVSGIVLRVGEQVTQFQAGDFVFAIAPGTHRTVLRAKASMCQRIPTGFNFEDAACLSLANCTAYHALMNIACIRKGQSILIHDATSNVGQAAVQLAKHKGLDIFATTRSASERDVLKDVYNVANDRIFLRDSNFSNGILRMTNGIGIDYVLNSSIGDQLQETWNCLASCGTYLEISSNTSRSTPREMRLPLKDYIFASINMRHIQSQRPDIMAGILRNTFEFMEQGIFKPAISVTVHPISQIERAMDSMKSTENLESIALSFSPDDLIPVLCKPESRSLKLSGDSTYLIVGGLGDLGRSLARFLVDSGARHICFISRSGAVQDVQKQLVTDLTSSGVDVQVYKCDIASFSALKDMLALCSREMPPISGAIHSALVLRDAILHNMTYTQWVEAVGPKLQGSRDLNELLPRNLDFFVALGSFISVIGGRSQSNYALGGAYQDGLADFRRSLGLRAVTINLGVVKDIGIIARNGAVGAARDWAEAFGLDEKELHTLVEHAISEQQTESSCSIPAQIITGIPTIGMVKQAGIPRPYYFDDPKFSILASMGAEQTPLTAKSEEILPSSLSLGEQLKGVPSIAEASKLVLNALVAEVAKLMQVDTGEIDTNKALYSHGVDSLVAVDMAHWIKKEIGADVVLSDITATVPITSFAKDITAKKFFNFEYLRVLGTSPFQGAEVGECLEAAHKIRSNDPESWYRAWSEAALKSEEIAETALRTRDREAARWAFLRSSNYRRASEFLLHHNPEDTRLSSTISLSIKNFKKACQLFDDPVHFLEIPYENGATLPAYLFMPTSASKLPGKTPVVISTGGFDSTQEELYYFTASGARTRGYATLSFEGPGQGIVVRRDKLHLRPDWEFVVGHVLDHLERIDGEHPEWNLDLSRVAIAGASMGGYFALRGALDPRISACISIDGFYDLAGLTRARVSGPLMTAIEEQYIPDNIFNTLLWIVLALDFQKQWELGHARLATGIPSPAAAMRTWKNYSMALPDGGTRLSQIKCPVLVTGSRDTMYIPVDAGPQRIYNELMSISSSEKKHELWIPSSPGQGSLQAKVAALAALHTKTFGWLDGVFGIQRESITVQG
ncbi:hypothetical protein ACHAPE_001969 [Trichoderma viride]